MSEKITSGEFTNVSWWDYANAKFLSNPPVGSKILCSCHNDHFGNVNDKFSTNVEVIAIHDGCIVVCRLGNNGKSYFAVSQTEIAPIDHLERKVEIERNKVVNAASNIFCNARSDIIGLRALYDAGMLIIPQVEGEDNEL